ncbi:uncharacterized protein LY89DRAFT_737476 [Mollisia scopiformis]|uniref:2EXR domain-containing protein n=1 Tax=Mollisia scopiformis TaxID=149040 RepID=A0A194WZX4_MOLSC|nr:uncharacterized protein LY89DRAFT_737476 [Mollisia scopiformis]KUJ13498.1 hypothetical protein LY89DRAFT_737476 [Mollisia scopiformis]
MSTNPQQKMNNQPTTFPQFPNLPPELQVLIWDLALSPHLIEFHYLDPRIPYIPTLWFRAHRLLPTTLPHALLSTVRASRARALSPHILTTQSPGNDLFPATQQASLPFNFRPSTDTIYIPAVFENIRSLALGGVLHKALYRSSSSGADIEVQQYFNLDTKPFAWELAAFENLEEVIIVVPPIERVIAIWKETRMQEVPAGKRYVVVEDEDEGECEGRVRAFGDVLEEVLGFWGRERNGEGWVVPRVRVMGEGEFGARFGVRRREGAEIRERVREAFDKARQKRPFAIQFEGSEWEMMLDNVGELENVRALLGMLGKGDLVEDPGIL